MKHPKYRVSDILFLDKPTLLELIQFVHDGAENLIDWKKSRKLQEFEQKYQISAKPKLEMTGSYTFGNARLRSDVDFNLAFPNWDMQQAARMLWYCPKSGIRFEFAKLLLDNRIKTGLGIDCGCVDAKSMEYNIHLDCESMLLHFRFDPDLDHYQPGVTPEMLEREESRAPINVLTFDPAKEEVPPVHNIHLKLDNYSFRWLPQTDALKGRPGQWLDDHYKDEIEEWAAKYGERFTGYVERDGKLCG